MKTDVGHCSINSYLAYVVWNKYGNYKKINLPFLRLKFTLRELRNSSLSTYRTLGGGTSGVKTC